MNCGCDTRKETIGSDNWWTGCTVAAAILILTLTYGGNVTKQTQSVIKIGIGGAVLAILANKVIGPKTGA